MLRASIPFALAIAWTCRLDSQSLHLSVEPSAGTPGTTFAITLANFGQADFVYDDCCSFPRITRLEGGKVFCPPCPLRPCVPGSGLLPAGGFLRFDWRPEGDPCPGVELRPEIYAVGWDGFPDSISSRLEVLPDDDSGLGAQPSTVRFGEPVKLTLKNTSPLIFIYNNCCFPPSILDPWGLQSLCFPCVDCVQPTELIPTQALTFDWTPGMNSCNRREYPGRYRLLWGGFFDGGIGIGKELRGSASVLVLPWEDRRLDLEISAVALHPGETLSITARNPLGAPVYRLRPGTCDDLILLDGLGREAFCGTACPPQVAAAEADVEVIPPGGSISTEVRIPDPGECGQTFGRWSVIWGRSFSLDPGLDPAAQVFGYGEIDVLPPVFGRGNCDGLRPVELTDAVFLLSYLFLGGRTPPCLDACDFDDSGSLDLTDALGDLLFLFQGGPEPPGPFPGPGRDVTGDALGCEG